MTQDIRWKLRFNNYLKALQTLDEAYALTQTRALSKLEQQGLIQSFEFTHELAWNVLKDYLIDQGIAGLIGSKDATRNAFKNGLITEGDDWMRMIADRNLTSHTYDQGTAQAIVDNILARYYPVSAPSTPVAQGIVLAAKSAIRTFQGNNASTASTELAAGKSRSTRRSQA